MKPKDKQKFKEAVVKERCIAIRYGFDYDLYDKILDFLEENEELLEALIKSTQENFLCYCAKYYHKSISDVMKVYKQEIKLIEKHTGKIWKELRK